MVLSMLLKVQNTRKEAMNMLEIHYLKNGSKEIATVESPERFRKSILGSSTFSRPLPSRRSFFRR